MSTLFIDRYGIPAPRHLVSEGKACRSRADDADRLGLALATCARQIQRPGDSPVPEEALQRVDRYGAVLAPAYAIVFTRMRADADNACNQRIAGRDRFPGPVVRLLERQPVLLMLRDDADPAPHIARVRAVRLARRPFLQLLRLGPEFWRAGDRLRNLSAAHGALLHYSPGRDARLRPACWLRRDSTRARRCKPDAASARRRWCTTRCR